MSLTAKQKAFVAEYLVDLNATQAAIRAGYSKRTAAEQGFRLLKQPVVAAALAAAIEKRSDETGIDAAWVLKQAVELHRSAIEVKAFSPAARALELVGKHVDVQAFRERMDHGFDLTALSDEQLEQLAKLYAIIAPR